MKKVLLSGIIVSVCLIPLFTIPVFAQQMGFYENELYEFSFNVPMDWRFLEDHQLPDGTIEHVLFYPSEFSIESLGGSEQLGPLDLFSGLPFTYDSPQISVIFENIAESKIPRLNSQELEKYELEFVRNFPSVKILNMDSESTSWGWIVSSKIAVSVNLGVGEAFQYIGEGKTYYFKDRDSYSVSYLAPDYYFDAYHPVYENVIDTIVIKGVIVPEFQEIAIIVLASSIILVVVFARKYKVMKILNS